MIEGIIKRCQSKFNSVELTILVDGKETRHFLEIPLGKHKLLQKGTKCQLELKQKVILKLVVDGEVVYEQDAKATMEKGHNYNKQPSKHDKDHSPAKPKKDKQAEGNTNSPTANALLPEAPYNFVPVNEKVIPAPAPPDFDRYHENRHTGYIDLKIETLTPLYIRGSYDEEKAQKADEAKKNGEKWENPDFFSPAGIPRIPGSSLRGMIRNLVEIVSYSKMEFVEDTTLYYRTLADGCKSVRLEYQKNMGQKDLKTKKTLYKFKAGYLEKDGRNYQIRPAQIVKGKQYYRTNTKYSPDFSWHWQDDESCVTVSGPAPVPKKKDWQINPVDKSIKPIQISAQDLEAYQNDINRFKDKRDVADGEKKDGDLLRCLQVEEKSDRGINMVPCFYVVWKDSEGKERVSFGHTAYFRLAYRLSIRKHLPPDHQSKEEVTDLTSAIFGKASDFAGRLFFEDAKLNEAQRRTIANEEYSPKILSGPKPTTFQHYIEQGNLGREDLLHWNNSKGLIRGYKLYWHRKTPKNGINGWTETAKNVEKHKTQYTLIKPIKENSIFNGRIRFEDLSDIELGALLFVLKLPEGCAHKIGMAKPLGLGSIRISPSLILINKKDESESRKGRYDKLFEKQQWFLAETQKTDEEVKKYQNKFSAYMLQETGQQLADSDPFKSYWKTERIKELKAMLNYDQNTNINNWVEITRYKEIEKENANSNNEDNEKNEFRGRPVLKSPLRILESVGVYYE